MEHQGVIGPTWRESTPWWEPEPEPPAGAPNVLVIVLDDVGFAQLGCYGSDIATPTIDRLAAEGLRLTNFHTTALCSPTRACLLTGRNHHRNGMARVADLALGYPGYNGRIPRGNGFLSEVLAANGYATYAVGKWHITPDDETHMAAPRDSWPVGRGFQRWYGFHGGETHQFVPWLFEDNHSIAPPRTPEEGYHLSADLADKAIEYLRDLRAVDDTQRFLLWFATGACHSPHHAPPEWINRYRGQFDDGWDAWRERTHARQLEMGVIPTGTKLAPRPPWVPAWDSLGAEDQKVAARFMECFAGFLSYTDAQIGRLVDHLATTGELDDTLIILVSDNGASAEGGEKGSINDVRLWNGLPAGRRELRERIDELGTQTVHNNYPWGWTMAGNTPLKRWKREVHEGGIADPCIIRWPGRIGGAAAGSVRRQFAHAIDVYPTVLDLVGIDAPTVLRDVPQTRIDGTSFVYLVDDAGATERHTTQYFEMLGSRAIYHDGWKAVTFKPMGGMYTAEDAFLADAPWDDDVWELYDKRNDFSECDNRAGDEPERLARMVDLWWAEARDNDVLPLDNRPLAAILNPRPGRRRDRPRYVLSPFGAPLPEVVGPNVKNRTHRIVARVNVPDGVEPNGVIAAMGSVLGGFAFYLLDGRPHYAHNHVGRIIERINGEAYLGVGEHELRVEITAPGDFSAEVQIVVDGKVVGDGKVPTFTAARFSITGGGLTCGYDHGPAVSPDYDAPFRPNFELQEVVVEVEGTPHVDAEAEFEAIMSEQ
jgi:arylsulfatase